MSVGIVGAGPAVAAVEAALRDVDVVATPVEPDALPEHDLAVVVGQVGDAVFEAANDTALAADLPWLAVELGGLGGYPVADASVAGFAPETGCYDCLGGRVASNLDPETEPAAAQPDHTARFAGAIAGRYAARFLTEEVVPFGRVRELPNASRRFLPLPGCPCGSAPDGPLPREHVDRDLEEALGRAEVGLDERLGIVQEIGEAESFPVPYYLARACDTAGFSDATAGRDAAGVAPGWDAAFMKALGEAMERYCAGTYRTADFEDGLADDVDGAVPPSAFVTRDDPAVDEPIPWVAAEDLATNADVMVPAELAYYPPPETRYRPAITTGLGLGNSGVEAILAGLYEVIERDATMLAWYSTFDPLGLEVGDETYDRLIARARSEDLSVETLLVTQDVDVPVVVSAVRREEWPRFALGSSAHLDPARAATSALTEALQNWMELRGMGPDDARAESGHIGRYADDPAEGSTFVDAASSVPAETVGLADVPTGAAELAAVLEKLDAADLAAYAVRTTTRDVAELGFEAGRTLVPRAQPLFFEEAYFGERAEAVPRELGFEPAPDCPHHPFP